MVGLFFSCCKEERRMETTLKYKRVLLKLSGESLSGEQGFGIDPTRAEEVAMRVREVREMGVDVAVVIGAGNLWRRSSKNYHAFRGDGSLISQGTATGGKDG